MITLGGVDTEPTPFSSEEADEPSLVACIWKVLSVSPPRTLSASRSRPRRSSQTRPLLMARRTHGFLPAGRHVQYSLRSYSRGSTRPPVAQITSQIKLFRIVYTKRPLHEPGKYSAADRRAKRSKTYAMSPYATL